MIAVQIEAPSVNHRIDFSSPHLPTNVAQAKIIVMFEEPANTVNSPDSVSFGGQPRIKLGSRIAARFADVGLTQPLPELHVQSIEPMGVAERSFLTPTSCQR